MSLKRSVVIKNQYTVKSKATGKGSRGSTPGAYVVRYMAREKATEIVAPIRRQRLDEFITRYMARDDATERAISFDELREEMKVAQGRSGVAFGYGSVSLSDEELGRASRDLQKRFEAGNTVMKTIISFDEEYLRRHKIVRPDFVNDGPGSYRGQIDQMKLRMAVMHGLDRMGSRYDDLRYVGVIQVDTEHVHCHLAMTDAGPGRLAGDGTQKGKLGSKGRSLLRRGIDSWLDEAKTIQHMSSAVQRDKTNVTTYVKSWAHEQIVKESLPQFLLACLPEDRTKWRAGTNRKEMAKPNRILREIVEAKLAEPDSPMPEAMVKVHSYADQRRRQEDLSPKQWAALVDTGRERIVQGCMNGVYGMLQAVPQEQLRVRTPLLEVMGMDMAEVTAKAHEQEPDPMIEFGFRLRSYSSRLQHHTRSRQEYRQESRAWQEEADQGKVSDASVMLARFYQEEEEYQARCAAKYRHFLDFPPHEREWYEDWQEVERYRDAMLSVRMMSQDPSLRAMKDPQEAEARGYEIYGQRGGRWTTQGVQGKQRFQERLEAMDRTYQTKLEDLKVTLAGKGLTMTMDTDEEGRDRPVITPGPEYPFEDVKGLDLHHLEYDFSRDTEIGPRAKSQFIEWAGRRKAALTGAVQYLESTGQAELVETLPVEDVVRMDALAQQLSQGRTTLRSRVAELVRRRAVERRSKTVRLSEQLSTQTDRQIQEAVRRVDPVQLMSEPSVADQPARETSLAEGLG